MSLSFVYMRVCVLGGGLTKAHTIGEWEMLQRVKVGDGTREGCAWARVQTHSFKHTHTDKIPGTIIAESLMPCGKSIVCLGLRCEHKMLNFVTLVIFGWRWASRFYDNDHQQTALFGRLVTL